MRDDTARRLSALHTWLYRLTRGSIGRRLVDNDMLLLTTKGRRTGVDHTVPLLYLSEGDDLIVIASWGGRPDHPEWYKNLLATPQATVQIRGDRHKIEAVTATSDEKERLWSRVLEAYDGYRTYQSKTSRDIPIVFLRRIPG